MPRRPARPFRAAPERLEDRLALSSGLEPTEVYSWQIINRMRADPARFAAEVQALYDGVAGTYHGYSASDPVWTELRGQIDQGRGKDGWTLESTLSLLRAQPKLPGYLLQDDLTARAFDHTEWMKRHGFAHTGVTTLGGDLPGFAEVADVARTQFDHDAMKYASPRGENINYAYNTDWAVEAPYKAGTLGRDGYLQRLAYFSTMTYILDIGLPDLGHLRNLLGRPDGVAGTSGALAITNFDSIGIDQSFLSYQQDADVPNYYLSTHRLDNVRDDGAKAGQYSGLSFADANQNGIYDVGEAYQLTAVPAVSAMPPPTPTPTLESVTPTPSVSTTVPAAPQVVGLRAIRGRKQGVTAVVVAFDQAMDPAAVGHLGVYQLAAAGSGKKARRRPVRLAGASLDPTANTVTLTLARPFREAGALRLIVSPSGLLAAGGRASAGVYSATVPR